jgi:hypothetical protein
MTEIPKMSINGGEGFKITLAFLMVYVVQNALAAWSHDTVMLDLAKNFGSIIGMIAIFWFTTRGQTSAQTIESEPLKYVTTLAGDDTKGE